MNQKFKIILNDEKPGGMQMGKNVRYGSLCHLYYPMYSEKLMDEAFSDTRDNRRESII